MGYCQALARLSKASRIVSMSAPWFESPDAYETWHAARRRIVWRYARRRRSASVVGRRRHVDRAIPNTLTPSFSSIKNTDDTMSKPGAVLRVATPPHRRREAARARHHAVGHSQFHHHRAECVNGSSLTFLDLPINTLCRPAREALCQLIKSSASQPVDDFDMCFASRR